MVQVYPNLAFDFQSSTTINGSMGILLSFLLVFKSNISYGQYWEARGYIGDLVKSCRAIGTQVRDRHPLVDVAAGRDAR
eukprot:9065272-Pyramimonas_sp.AAC.1